MAAYAVPPLHRTLAPPNVRERQITAIYEAFFMVVYAPAVYQNEVRFFFSNRCFLPYGDNAAVVVYYVVW